MHQYNSAKVWGKIWKAVEIATWTQVSFLFVLSKIYLLSDNWVTKKQTREKLIFWGHNREARVFSWDVLDYLRFEGDILIYYSMSVSLLVLPHSLQFFVRNSWSWLLHLSLHNTCYWARQDNENVSLVSVTPDMQANGTYSLGILGTALDEGYIATFFWPHQKSVFLVVFRSWCGSTLWYFYAYVSS